MNIPRKHPLLPNGGTPIDEADMPLDELTTQYVPDSTVSKDAPEPPAMTQNGDAETE